MVEEGTDERGVEVFKVKCQWGSTGAGLHEAEQQPESVAVGDHAVRADLALADEPVGEECLQGGSARRHDALPKARSRRCEANACNSVAADKYYAEAPGSTSSRLVDKARTRSCTVSP